jgi:hypothetical protein
MTDDLGVRPRENESGHPQGQSDLAFPEISQEPGRTTSLPPPGTVLPDRETDADKPRKPLVACAVERVAELA